MLKFSLVLQNLKVKLIDKYYLITNFKYRVNLKQLDFNESLSLLTKQRIRSTWYKKNSFNVNYILIYIFFIINNTRDNDFIMMPIITLFGR